MATVLILEDDLALNRMMQATLTLENHRVLSARRAEDGLDYLSSCPDVIVLDIHVPGMDGPTFLTAAMERGFKGPVLVVSGASDGGMLADLMGADGFLKKPFAFEDLQISVEKLAEKADQVDDNRAEEAAPSRTPA